MVIVYWCTWYKHFMRNRTTKIEKTLRSYYIVLLLYTYPHFHMVNSRKSCQVQEID